MEEMRLLIAKRSGDSNSTPRSKGRSTMFDSPTRESSTTSMDGFTRSVEILVVDADRDLTRAQSSQERLQDNVKQLAADFKTVSYCHC